MHSSSAEMMLACRQTKRTKKNEIHHDSMDFSIISTFPNKIPTENLIKKQ